MDTLINSLPSPIEYLSSILEPWTVGILETLENYEFDGRKILIIYAKNHNRFFKAESHNQDFVDPGYDIFEGIKWTEVRPHNITTTHYLSIQKEDESDDLPF